MYWTANSILPVSLKFPHLCVYPVHRRVCTALNSELFFISVSEVSLPLCVPIVQEGV